jgi:hypothetical protein
MTSSSLLDSMPGRGVPVPAGRERFARISLKVCLLRNRGWPADDVADAGGLRDVHATLESPIHDEGCVDVRRVHNNA